MKYECLSEDNLILVIRDLISKIKKNKCLKIEIKNDYFNERYNLKVRGEQR